MPPKIIQFPPTAAQHNTPTRDEEIEALFDLLLWCYINLKPEDQLAFEARFTTPQLHRFKIS